MAESGTERSDEPAARLASVREELERMGFDRSLFWRTPGRARAPVAYFQVGESPKDVEQTRTFIA